MPSFGGALGRGLEKRAPELATRVALHRARVVIEGRPDLPIDVRLNGQLPDGRIGYSVNRQPHTRARYLFFFFSAFNFFFSFGVS